MDKTIALCFDIDKVEEFKQLADSRFSKATFHCFSDGENAHTEPVNLEDLEFSAETIYDIPIKVQFTNLTSDGIGTHDKSCFNVGFIPRQDNPVRFTKDEKSKRTFLTIDGLIWNGDSKNIIEILTKTDGKKKVSVEMGISDYEEGEDGRLKIKKFIFTAICILSDSIAEACKGANIQLHFARDKKNFIKMNYADTVKKITIDNTKESAIGWNGAWTNPERKLYVPLLKQSNPAPYVKEAYLVVGEDYKNSPSTNLKYPHHKIVGDKMVVSAVGVIAAFKRAAQAHILRGDVLNHLKRHDKELGLGLNFNFESESFSEYINDLEDDYMSEEDMKDKLKNDEDIHHEDIHDEEPHNKEPHGEDVHDEDPHDEGSHNEDPHDEHHCDDMSTKYTELEKKCKELEEKYADMEKKCAELENSNKSYMAQIEAMKDYADLKKFREDTMAREKEENEKAEMAKTFSEIANRGFKFSKENEEALIKKFSEFANLTAWTNYVKAFALDNFKVGESDGQIIDIPALHVNNQHKGLWD